MTKNLLVFVESSFLESVTRQDKGGTKTLRQIEPDTPIIIDPTDIAKPRARKMNYVSLVRDGSEPLRNG